MMMTDETVVDRARSHGEVFTPDWMVQQMLAPLATDLAVGHRILDLCCGPGAFLTAVLSQRLDSPEVTTMEEALAFLTSLYGMELLADSAQACRMNLLIIMRKWARKQQLEETTLVSRAQAIVEANVLTLDVLTTPLAEIEMPVWDDNASSPRYQPLVEGFFDVIISNPPYQRNIADSGHRNRSKALPLYHHIYDLALSLHPTAMTFIIPAKWYTGGWGLDAWRQRVLADKRIVSLHDYRNSRTVFPSAEVNGGICVLLWRTDHQGPARVIRHNRAGEQVSDRVRPLLEPGADFFIRDERAVDILHRIGSLMLEEEETFTSMVLGTTPFGIPSNFTDYETQRSSQANISLYYIKERIHWITREQVQQNSPVVDEWKIFLPLSHDQHSSRIIGRPRIFGPASACTHSYLCIRGFASEEEAENCVTYMRTKFFRFLAHQLKISPIATRRVYRLIPVQAWDRPWNDEDLYTRYGLDPSMIDLIESTISDLPE